MDVILRRSIAEVIDDGRGCRWISIRRGSGGRTDPSVDFAFRKFSNKNYQFSGGLHSGDFGSECPCQQSAEVTVRAAHRQVYNTRLENGEKCSDLQVVGTCGKRNTGNSAHFGRTEKFLLTARVFLSRHARSESKSGACCVPAWKSLLKMQEVQQRAALVLPGWPERLSGEAVNAADAAGKAVYR